jgi:hypothetical protein
MKRRVSDVKLDSVLSDIDGEIRRTARKLPFATQTEAEEDMEAESAHLTELLRQRSELVDLRSSVEKGHLPGQDYRSHLENPAVALPPPTETGYILTVWSVVSVPLILLSLAAVLVFDSITVAGFTAIVAAGVLLAEQLARRRFQAVIRLAAVYAAAAAFSVFAIGGVFLVGRFAIGAIITVAAGVLFISNLGELGAAARHRRRTQAAAEQVSAGSQPD